jgi:hypothetical protein
VGAAEQPERAGASALTGVVRGAADSGTLPVRWYSDEECNDRFALEVVAAINGLLVREVKAHWNEPPDEPDGFLVGKRGSPSVVWHAAAVGTLLELGFLPSARCVYRHLRVLEACLRPANARNPATHPWDSPWLLRTRHVAWVLACLAEMPRVGSDGARSEKAVAAFALHETVITTAYEYLVQRAADPADPSSWISRDEGSRVWQEHWDRRRAPNLLNTLYALIGLCRAARHGFLPPDAVLVIHGDVQELILADIDHQMSAHGLSVQLRGRWNEEWAQDQPPPGILGLITVLLVEYAEMLFERAGAPAIRYTNRAYIKAQRLAHYLAANPEDWWKHADYFLHVGAEGAWAVPSFSVCTRALLESGAVDPYSNVIARAFETIEGRKPEHELPPRGAVPWTDPTRGFDLEITDDDQARGHVRRKLPDARGRAKHINAGGIHAAVMAYSALRRAVRRADPRDVLHPHIARQHRQMKAPRAYYASSPFIRLELEPLQKSSRCRACLSFSEQIEIPPEITTFGPTQTALLLALPSQSEDPATLDELVERIQHVPHHRCAQWGRKHDREAVADVITEINRRTGTAVIDSRDRADGSKGYYRTVRLDPGLGLREPDRS